MLSPRSSPRSAGFVVLTAAAVAVAGCSGSETQAGPPRISPAPQHEVAAAMVNDRPEPQMRLNACELLDLTATRVITLTGADMPDIQPTGSGDLGQLCTYGGPGSLERYQAEREVEESGAAATGAEPPEATEAAETGTPGTTTTSATSTTPPPVDPDHVPDTFAAGVVKPRVGAGAALAGQPVMLGNRYGCSEIRGEAAESIEGGGAGVPEAPAPVVPELDSAYIDCTATTTGGGVEVHTIFVADSDLWHLTLVSPGTPRSPESDAAALAGLHRVAGEVLS